MSDIFEPFEFSIIDIENLRLHYARTCRDWLSNFERVTTEVSAMYNDEFARSWRLYLAGSSAGFHTGTLQLYQVLFVPHGNNGVPWTRRYQYGDGDEKEH
jgi:cyclopropane-fatty-acyl-phospholipid synthase